MSDPQNARGTAPLIGNLLLVAVVIVVGVVLMTLSLAFLDGVGTPTAEASFEYERTPAGLRMMPAALGTDVTVKLNGESVTSFDADEAGQSALLPTAPGDRITVVASDDEKSVLVDETIDEQAEVGDFIAYYTFASDSGSTVVDRSGNGNEGTFENDASGDGPEWAGCGVRFNGASDHIEVDDIASPRSNVDEFTIAVAYRQQGNDDSINQLVEHVYGGTGNEWFLETVDTGTGTYRIDYAVKYPDQVIAAGDYELGERHVAVGTYDSDTGTYELYVDGKLQQSDTHTESVNTGTMRMGRDFESEIQYLDGEICEVRLYYAAFDASEVAVISEAMS